MKKEFNEIYNVLTESWYEGQETRNPNQALRYALHYFGVVLDRANKIKESGVLGSKWLDEAIYTACKNELERISTNELSKIPKEYNSIIEQINEKHSIAIEQLNDIFSNESQYPGNRPD